MILGIMQPYFLPYLGYWQLLAAVDRFVVYDDVQYIKGGWINRNRIKIGGEPNYISLQLDGASPNRRICDIALLEDRGWRGKLLRTVEQSYAGAPFLRETIPLFLDIVGRPEPDLAGFLLNQIKAVADHLAIDTDIVPTSRGYGNDALKGPARVIDICRRENANVYLNSLGGREMYLPGPFAEAGVELRFYSMRSLEYPQGKGVFRPCLSILDVLMWVGKTETGRLLREVDIVQP